MCISYSEAQDFSNINSIRNHNYLKSEEDLILEDSIRNDTSRLYSKIDFIAGTNGYQSLDLTLKSLNYSKRYIEFNLNRNAYNGDFRNSINSSYRGNVRFRQLLNNGTLEFSLNSRLNNCLNQENAGLLSDSLFLNEVNDNQLFYDVNIESSSQRVNYNINKFGFKFFKDSIYGLNNIGKTNYILADFSFGRYLNKFTIQDINSFYSTNIYNLNGTSDYYKDDSIYTELGYKFGKELKTYALIKIGGNRIINYELDSLLIYSELKLKNQIRLKNGLKLSNEFSLPILGRNLKGFNNLFSLDITNKVNHQLSIQLGKLKPDFRNEIYHSNHFLIDTILAQVSELKIEYGLGVESFSLDIENNFTKNGVYFDEKLNINQDFNINGYSKIGLGYKNKINRINIKLKGAYNILYGKNIFRLPAYVLLGDLSYKFGVFNSKLKLSLGAKLRYSDSFYNYAYDPVLFTGYIDDTRMVGNYPFINAYISGRILDVVFVFEVSHLNQGLMGNDYFLSPGYPDFGRIIKFGLKWQLWD